MNHESHKPWRFTPRQRHFRHNTGSMTHCTNISMGSGEVHCTCVSKMKASRLFRVFSLSCFSISRSVRSCSLIWGRNTTVNPLRYHAYFNLPHFPLSCSCLINLHINSFRGTRDLFLLLLGHFHIFRAWIKNVLHLKLHCDVFRYFALFL